MFDEHVLFVSPLSLRPQGRPTEQSACVTPTVVHSQRRSGCQSTTTTSPLCYEEIHRKWRHARERTHGRAGNIDCRRPRLPPPRCIRMMDSWQIAEAPSGRNAPADKLSISVCARACDCVHKCGMWYVWKMLHVEHFQVYTLDTYFPRARWRTGAEIVPPVERSCA